MSPSAAETAHTTALARAVVAQLAPEELPAFELLAGPYLTGTDASADGDRLQFGVMDAIVTATPAITLVCATVVAALARGAEGELEQLGGRATRRLLGALRRRPAAPEAPAAYSRQQLRAIRAVAARRATALGVEPALAAAIADAVVGALLTDEPEPGQ
ncbi:hypothetical protein [Micromonospora sp. WMMD1082]|uniref:hypothetical protein n=1 Tax=Micromonospora sp. WMMD1082 TaxID=3016104 RepID=UPI0024177CEE|nr:hypothetical protein [Micromonospora sp. WMMD1082]MDG4798415.1 hypothetical protein [Micromonospora sp. WMMD1082]